MTVRRALGVLASAVLLWACTDGGGVDNAADQKLADAALLTVDDLPNGFEIWPATTDGTDSSDRSEDSDYSDDEAFFDCLGTLWSEEDKPGSEVEARAKYRKPLANLYVKASVTYYDDEHFPAKWIDAFNRDSAVDCLKDAYVEAFPEKAGPLVTAGRPELPDIGDQRMSLVVDVPFDHDQFVFSQGTYAARVGRAVVSLSMSTGFGPLDDKLAADALTTMVDRLEDT